MEIKMEPHANRSCNLITVELRLVALPVIVPAGINNYIAITNTYVFG
jgi:hypothetical protein